MRKYLKSQLTLTKQSDDGSFTGYGSVFGNKDSYSDVVLKGAFSNSIKKLTDAGSMPAFLWQHKHDEPIGVYTKMFEDDYGLVVEGQINLEVQKGREAHSLMKQGALDGLSIGYDVPKDGGKWNDEKSVFELSNVNLWEVSLVTFPANDLSRVSTVKSETQGSLTIRDVERTLRDVCGLSSKEAKRFCADGFKAIATDERDVVDVAVKEEVEALQKLLSTIKRK